MAQGLTSLLFRTALGVLGALFVIFMMGFAIGYLGLDTGAALGDVTLWIMGAIAVVAMAASMVVGTYWMRSIDEAAQEAHKSAWYWGGSVGMCVAGVGIIMATTPHAAQWAFTIGGRSDPAIYMAVGAMVTLALMLVGYIVAWGLWWFLRGRG